MIAAWYIAGLPSTKLYMDVTSKSVNVDQQKISPDKRKAIDSSGPVVKKLVKSIVLHKVSASLTDKSDSDLGDSIQHGWNMSQDGLCPHCNKMYSNQSALKYHVRLVHSDMSHMFCCHLCPESFKFREHYKIHMWEAHNVRS